MQRKIDPMAPLFAALDKLAQVGVEEAAIATLCRELPTAERADARWREIKWRSTDKDRKKTAAVAALKKWLKKSTPRALPADVLATLRGDASWPCWLPAQTRDALRALVVDALPEQTLFDDLPDGPDR